MPKKRLTPHDRYIKSIMSNPKVVREFFEKNLPNLAILYLTILSCSVSTGTTMEYSTPLESMDDVFSKKTGKTKRVLYVSVVDSFRFDMKDYSKKGPYTLEEESDEYLRKKDSVTSAKLYIVSAIKGNLDTQEYFQSEFGKSPKALEALMSNPGLARKFVAKVAKSLWEEFKESESHIDVGDATVPSGKTVITTQNWE